MRERNMGHDVIIRKNKLRVDVDASHPELNG